MTTRPSTTTSTTSPASRTTRSTSASPTSCARASTTTTGCSRPGRQGHRPWESTFYVNPGSYDIRDLKPYAAYDITRDEWAVKPVEVPDDFGPEKLPESTWDVLDALQKLIGAIQELPAGTREREGAALYDYLHADRHSAFGPEDRASMTLPTLSGRPSTRPRQAAAAAHRLETRPRRDRRHGPGDRSMTEFNAVAHFRQAAWSDEEGLSDKTRAAVDRAEGDWHTHRQYLAEDHMNKQLDPETNRLAHQGHAQRTANKITDAEGLPPSRSSSTTHRTSPGAAQPTTAARSSRSARTP